MLMMHLAITKNTKTTFKYTVMLEAKKVRGNFSSSGKYLRSLRFYHLTRLYFIFIQNSALKSGGNRTMPPPPPHF